MLCNKENIKNITPDISKVIKKIILKEYNLV